MKVEIGISCRDGRLYHLYLGPRLSSTDSFYQRGNENHLAYATFGTDNLFEPAIRVLHNDGNPSLELIYVSHETANAGNNATLTRILLREPMYPFEVTLFCKAFAATDVFEQ